MALVLEGCDGAPVMWGKIGDYIVQRMKNVKMYIRRNVPPSNPRTQAQQDQRSAMREGVYRWKNHEKITNKAYWDGTAKEYGFLDGYRAFLSSFLTSYREKLGEFNDPVQALDYVKNISNSIFYKESQKKKALEEHNRQMIQKVFAYRKTEDFENKVRSTLLYLKDSGLLNRIKFGFLPDLKDVLEGEWHALGLI